MIAVALDELEPIVGIAPACKLTGLSRATRYRREQPPMFGPPKPRPSPPNALTDAERAEVLAVLRSEQYCDLAVAQVWAMILDDGRYLCSRSRCTEFCARWVRPVTGAVNAPTRRR